MSITQIWLIWIDLWGKTLDGKDSMTKRTYTILLGTAGQLPLGTNITTAPEISHAPGQSTGMLSSWPELQEPFLHSDLVKGSYIWPASHVCNLTRLHPGIWPAYYVASERTPKPVNQSFLSILSTDPMRSLGARYTSFNVHSQGPAHL